MSKASHEIGLIGLDRMGEAMAARPVKSGGEFPVWRRAGLRRRQDRQSDPLPAAPKEFDELVVRGLTEDGKPVKTAGIKAP
jgi:hypothetical protein